ncbi:hypothetical protein AAHC03_09690 [Spirometra sp. Aus1]
MTLCPSHQSQCTTAVLLLSLLLDVFVLLGNTDSHVSIREKYSEPNPPDMIFSGESWLKYHLKPYLRLDTPALFIRFKTVETEGVIVFAEVDSAKLESAKFSVYLSNGSLILSIWSHETSTFGAFQQQFSCQSAFKTCADGRWHDINISSAFSLLQIDVDQRSASELLPKALHGLRMKVLIIGGRPPGIVAFGALRDISNFSGCLQHAFYHSGPNQIDFLQLLKEQLDVLQVFGVNLNRCSSSGVLNGTWTSKSRRNAIANDMVTFTRPGGYLLLRGWKTVSRGRIAFRLRTFRKNCLLLYSSSSWPLQSRIRNLNEVKRKAGALGRLLEVVNASDRLTGTDLFSVELREGFLVLLLNTGSGINEFRTESILRQKKSEWFTADGKEHSVEIGLSDGSLQVTLDGIEHQMKLTKKPRYTYLNLNGGLYVGGLPEELRLSGSDLPPQVWSAHLRKDFIGCIGHLEIDGEPADLHLEAMATWARDHVKPGCRPPSDACGTETCAPGACDEGWTEPVCECADKNRDGPLCEQEAKILIFNGFQGIELHLSKLPHQSEAESLILRFQTKQQNCRLFESASAISTAPDRFSLEIMDGRLVLFYNLGHKTWNVSTKPQISDGSWHTLRVLRRSRRLEVKVDDTLLAYNISDEATMLDSDYICIGSLGQSRDPLGEDGQEGHFKVAKSDSFVGRLSHLHMNGLNVLRLLRALPHFRHGNDHMLKVDESEASIINAWKDNIEVSASVAKNDADDILEFPIHFRDGRGLLEYVLNPQKRCTTLTFFMKTRSTVGVIFTILSNGGDFMQAELVGGMLSIHYKLDINRGQSTARNAGHINNTSWNKIKFRICIERALFLDITVNGIKHEPPSADINMSRPAAFSRLLLGGPPDGSIEYQPHHQVEKNLGYDGCLAKISVSQSADGDGTDDVLDPVNPLRFAKSLRYVEAGCHLTDDAWEEDSDTTCRPGVCGFGGRCVQQLKTYFCDCSMTGFTGPVCTDVATTVTFTKSGHGCAALEFNPLRNTTKDAIAFGIQTKHREPVVLLHITSHSKSLDFLRIELTAYRKRSVLRLTYNMGNGIQVLQDSSVDLADGNFHVIRVVRTKSMAKLQIDSEDVLERDNPNANGTDFNEIHQIYIGCDPTTLKDRKNEAHLSSKSNFAENRFFVGHLTGLTLNGISIGDILLGESVPGIYVKMSQSLKIDPSFTPNLRQASHLPANDMEAVQPLVPRSSSMKTSPLVIAKPTCIEPEAYSKLANCKPSNPHGIVQPHWNLPPLEATDAIRWNKEQYASPYAQGSGNLDIRQQPKSEEKNSFSEHKEKFSPMKDSNVEEHRAPLFELWDKAPHDDTRLVAPVSPRETVSHSTAGFEEIHPEPLSPLQSLNLWIVISIVGVVLASFAILVYLLFRCRRRNEGSYNVEENHTFIERGPAMRKFADENDGDAGNTVSASGPSSATTATGCVGDRSQRSKVKLLLTSPSSSDAYELRTAVVATGSELSPSRKSDLAHSSSPASCRLPTRSQPQSPNKEWYV